MNGVGDRVAALTEHAMSTGALSQSLYQQRLDLIRPTRRQVEALTQRYRQQVTPNVVDVIRLLQQLNKTVYALSAGMNPAVVNFATWLNLPEHCVFAVDLRFDSAGAYVDYDRASPLVENTGKLRIIAQLQQQHQSILHVGDGANDQISQGVVARFVGFGGHYFRPELHNSSQFYLTDDSMLGLLPLALLPEEVSLLTTQDQMYYHKGYQLICKGGVHVNDR